MSDSMIKMEDKSTEQLTIEANVQYRQAENLAQMSIVMLADVGRKLIEIKSRIQHGQFEDWCNENLEFSTRQADRYMDLASKMDDKDSIFSNPTTLSDIGISKVWALLAAPEEVAVEVVETKDVENISVRELKDEISRLKKEKEQSDEERDRMAKQKDEIADARVKLDQSLADAKAKLIDANEKLKNLKDKQKEEVRKRIEESTAEVEERIRKENAESIKALEEQIDRLEAEKVKLGDTSIMEFKFMVDQLQETWFKIGDLIAKQSDEAGAKMSAALHKLVEGWIHEV